MKHLLEVIKPDKLTYRHALLVAMPIELLQVLVQYNALADYVDTFGQEYLDVLNGLYPVE